MSAKNHNDISGVPSAEDAPNKMEILDSFPPRLRLLIKNAPYNYVVKNIPTTFKGVPLSEICTTLERVMSEHVRKAYQERGFEP